MKIEKSSMSVEKDRIRFSVPFAKVDAERRLVHGFATLDNVDRQKDVVLAEASLKAFRNFAGNIREMHQPIAAGRLVSFREDSFYDSNAEKFFNGVYVSAYVSKGAESTWQKVLDGTLAGFSIAGPVNDSYSKYVPEEGAVVQFITDYDLTELSLVDSPANQLANIFSVEKSSSGELMVKGLSADVDIESIFWCSEEKIARTSASDGLDCDSCGSKMENIGFYETTEDRTERVAEVVNKFLSGALETPEVASETDVSDNAEDENDSSVKEEGGVNVPENRVETDVETAEEVVEVDEAAAAVEDSDEATETVEEPSSEASDVSEVPDVPDFEKMFADLQKSIAEGFDTSKSDVEKKFEEVTSTFESKLGDLRTKHDELTEKFNALKDGVDGVEKALAARVESVEKFTAVKKSGDLGGSTEGEVSKASSSRWAGAFLAVSDL